MVPSCPMTQRGLTLVELMMVIVIVGILAGVSAMALLGVDDKARVATVHAEMETIRKAIQTYRMESGGHLPQTLEDLITGPVDYAGQWRIPFEDRKLPVDPWGNAYLYAIVDPDTDDYTLTSLGKDGKPGGKEFNADIIWPAPEAAE